MEEEKRKRIFSIAALGLLLVGLVVGVVLVGRQQLLRTQAEVDITSAFNIKDASGNPISCNNNVCDTSTLDVTIELKPDGLNTLSQ